MKRSQAYPVHCAYQRLALQPAGWQRNGVRRQHLVTGMLQHLVKTRIMFLEAPNCCPLLVCQKFCLPQYCEMLRNAHFAIALTSATNRHCQDT